MRTIFILSTKAGGTVKSHETDARTWGELANELKQLGSGQYNPDGMRAIDATNTVEFLDKSSILSEESFTLSLQPVKVKAGGYNTYTLKYTPDQIEGLAYSELKTELKSIKAQSIDYEDNISDIIGNYTQMTVANLKAKLTEVYSLISVPPVGSPVQVDLTEVTDAINSVKQAVETLSERILALEFACSIINTHNIGEYEDAARKAHARIAALTK